MNTPQKQPFLDGAASRSSADGVTRILIATFVSVALVQGIHGDQFAPVYDLNADLGTVSSVDAMIYGSYASNAGESVRLGDLNGDGVNDLIVCAPVSDYTFSGSVTRSDAGVVHVWFGGAGFLPPLLTDLAATPADLTIVGASTGDRLMSANRPLGMAPALVDFNGDGIQDLVLNAPLANGPGEARPQCGEVYVIFGRTVFPSVLDLSVAGNNGANVTIHGRVPNAHLQLMNSGRAADFNGDGFDDILVFGEFGLERRINIFFGRASFPPVLDAAATGASGPDVLIKGEPFSLMNIVRSDEMISGDVNGDGVDDLLVADHSWQRPTSTMPEGRVDIIFGRKLPAVWPSILNLDGIGYPASDVTIRGASAGDGLTYGGNQNPLMAVGDLNGDGVGDVILGATSADGPGESRSDCGEAYILFGRAHPAVWPATLNLSVQGPGGADVTVYGSTVPNDGQELLGEGGGFLIEDLNGDGRKDLVIGSWRTGDYFEPSGSVRIVNGRASFPATMDFAVPGTASAVITGGFPSAFLTQDGAMKTGDFNGDGRMDLVLGGGNWRLTGHAMVIFGRPGGFAASTSLGVPGAMSIACPPGQFFRDGNYGMFYAGDLDADGLDDLVMGFPGGDGPTGTNRFAAGEVYLLRGRTGLPSFEPEITVEQPSGSGLVSGLATVDCGTANVFGTAAPVEFTVRNPGGFPLYLTNVIITGADAADFILSPPVLPYLLVPGESVIFSVTLFPSAEGPRSATLQIINDDADEGLFTVVLRGRGNTAPILQLPPSPFVVAATSPAGAIVVFPLIATDFEDTPDPLPVATPASGETFPLGETTVNVTVTDSAGLTTTGSFVVRVDAVPGPQMGEVQIVGGNQVRFTISTVAGRSYQVEFKDDLNAATWQPLGGPRSASGASLTVTDTLANAQRFYRVSLVP